MRETGKKNLWSFSAVSFVLHLVWYVTHAGHMHTRHTITYAHPDLHTPNAHPLLTFLNVKNISIQLMNFIFERFVSIYMYECFCQHA